MPISYETFICGVMLILYCVKVNYICARRKLNSTSFKI